MSVTIQFNRRWGEEPHREGAVIGEYEYVPYGHILHKMAVLYARMQEYEIAQYLHKTITRVYLN